jgi:pyruvate formate lyase activating enzyme
VLDTLLFLRHETDCWFEITTLLIPGLNDDSSEIEALSRWVSSELGPDVPLHFTAFHPDFKMLDRPPTPPATLRRARAIALANGLHYVYTGNVHDVEGGTTCCPGCGEPLVRRDWYEVLDCALDASASCPQCGTRVAGRFGAIARGFGRRRIPVRLEAAGSEP